MYIQLQYRQYCNIYYILTYANVRTREAKKAQDKLQRAPHTEKNQAAMKQASTVLRSWQRPLRGEQ
jgi:hypothetical protein